MALKTVFSSADEIPEGLKDHYIEKDGKFILVLDGDMPGHVPESELNALKAKVAEFRDTNTSVMKTRDELKAQLEKFDGVDLEKYEALKTQVADLEKKGLKKPSDLDQQIKAAVEAAVTPLTQQVTNLTEERKTLAASLERKDLADAISKEVLPFIHAEALPYVTEKALQVFRNVDGQMVPMNGETPIYSPQNPTEHMTPKEWLLDRLKTEAPFVFKASKGTNSPGSEGDPPPGTRTLVNPSAEDFGKNLEDIASGKAVVQTA